MTDIIRPTAIRFSFVEDGAAAEAMLLWDVAPKTCAAVVGALPVRGTAHHAIYSGSECVQLLNEVVRIEPENATSEVAKGDVAFTWMAAGSSFGVDRDFAEICWFYDLDGQPWMWEGPVEVNVFAKFVSAADDFYAVCRRMRREGVKPLSIEAVIR
jgi:hypothetical protein